MIGKVCYSLMPYFNAAAKTNAFKSRPVLIIGVADSGDYNVLPLSRVTNSRMIDKDYDVPVSPAAYPKLNLTAQSYVRVHKQTVVNKNSISTKNMSDMKTDYPDLFIDILSKLEDYNKKLLESAL